MSRARRAKENKTNFKIWIPIICIVVVAITFYIIHDMQNKIEEDEVENTIDTEENIQDIENEAVEENIIEENMVEENIIEENTVENETTNTEQDVSTKDTVEENATSTQKPQSSAPAQPGVTDQKQKAIELVKKEWGEDDTVNYMFDYINENGEYVIAVKDKASATVKNYFRVNLEKETVELD